MVTAWVGGHREDTRPEGGAEAVHRKDTDSVRRKLGCGSSHKQAGFAIRSSSKTESTVIPKRDGNREGKPGDSS